MSVFQDVCIEWDGKKYTIPSDQVLKAIAIIEEHFTIQQLISNMSNSENIKLVKLTSCIGEVLRYAGADVSDEKVYAGMFKEGEAREKVMQTIQVLVMMMLPPEKLAEIEDGGNTGTPGKRTTRKRTTTRRKSSKVSTKR